MGLTFRFSLDAPEGSVFRETNGVRLANRRVDYSRVFAALQKLTEAFCDEFAFPADGRVVVLAADSPSADRGLRKLEEWRSRLGVVPGFGAAIQDMPDPEELGEWYGITRRQSTCPPDEVLPGRHVMGYYSVVSEEFVRAVTSAGLRGLEFAWLEDTSRFRAPAWYYAVATHPIGRGVDHPWVNVAAISQDSSGCPPIDPQHRAGICTFGVDQIRRDVELPPFARRAVALCGDTKYARVSSTRRFLRTHLPESDFAYFWTQGRNLNRSAAVGPPRGARLLCVSRRAREHLIRAGVLAEEETAPVAVCDRPPLGCEDLDATASAPMPDPQFTLAELGEYRVRVRASYERWRAQPRPRRLVAIEDAVALLKDYMAKSDEEPSGVDSSEFDLVERATGLPVAKSWRRVAPLLPSTMNGRSSDQEFDLIEPHGVPGYHASVSPAGEDESGDACQGLLHGIGGTMCGDWYSLVTDSPAMPDDCAVVKWDHETSAICRRWDTVAAFVQELVVWATEKER